MPQAVFGPNDHRNDASHFTNNFTNPFDSFNSDVIENIIAAKPNYVEIFLNGLKRIIEAEKNKDFTEQVWFQIITIMHDYIFYRFARTQL